MLIQVATLFDLDKVFCKYRGLVTYVLPSSAGNNNQLKHFLDVRSSLAVDGLTGHTRRMIWSW